MRGSDKAQQNKLASSMFKKLNYYSRYNRIKEHSELSSLYNLIAGLNLDSLVSQHISITLHSHLPAIQSHRLSAHPYHYTQQGAVGEQRSSKSSHRRHSSEGPFVSVPKSDQHESGEQNQQQNPIQPKQEAVDESEEEEEEQSERELQQSQEVPSSKSVRKSGRNLEQMERLIKTESINSYHQGNQSDVAPNSPRIVRVERNSSEDNENNIKDSLKQKFSSIESMKVRRCSSHESDGQAVDGPYEGPMGDSSQDHREEDIYSEDFMEDINQLIRINEEDRKSTKQIVNLPDKFEHSKSEFLDRAYGSDIEMEEERLQQTVEEEYPSTSKKIIKKMVESQQVVHAWPEEAHIEEQQDESHCEQFGQEEAESSHLEKLDLNSRQNNSINNLQEIKETQSEEDHQVQESAVLQRVNFLNPSLQQFQTDENETPEKPIEISPTAQRKSFKKVIKQQQQQTQKPHSAQSSPINFKATKKLNPRLVTSTIVTESIMQRQSSGPIPMQKKMNFKKALIRGEQNKHKADSLENSRKIESLDQAKAKRQRQNCEDSRKLIQAFFEQN